MGMSSISHKNSPTYSFLFEGFNLCKNVLFKYIETDNPSNGALTKSPSIFFDDPVLVKSVQVERNKKFCAPNWKISTKVPVTVSSLGARQKASEMDNRGGRKFTLGYIPKISVYLPAIYGNEDSHE